jgi:hypothetical protein
MENEMEDLSTEEVMNFLNINELDGCADVFKGILMQIY